MIKGFKIVLWWILFVPNLIVAIEGSPQGNPLVPYSGRPGQFEIPLSISANDIKNALSGRFPSLFRGRASCMRALEQMRQTVGLVGPTLLIPETAPLFRDMRTHIHRMVPSHPQLDCLVQEIDHDVSISCFDIEKFYGYGFRVLGAISDAPTQDALSLFRKYRGEAVDRGIRMHWKSPHSVADIQGKGGFIYAMPTVSISEKMETLFEEEVGKIARLSLYYPCFNQTYLGFVTLIEAFIQRLYPIPISHKQNTAHGLLMTPFLFGYHDYLHGKIDNDKKDANFYSAAYHKLSHLFVDDLHPNRFVKPLAEFMVAKSNLIDDTLISLLNLYFTDYLPQRSIIDVKKALVGFFYMIHEEWETSPEIFDMVDFRDILTVFLEENDNLYFLSQEEISDDLEEIDILETDPLTGKTRLSPEQILDSILAADVSAKEHYQSMTPQLLLEHARLEGEPYQIDIIEQPMVINVVLRFTSAIEFTWEIPTLQYELLNARDSVYLLKIAGIVMVPPSEEDLSSKNGRQIAQDYLMQITKNINLCCDAFKTSAHYLLSIIPVHEEKSLQQKFQDKSYQISRRFSEAINAMKRECHNT